MQVRFYSRLQHWLYIEVNGEQTYIYLGTRQVPYVLKYYHSSVYQFIYALFIRLWMIMRAIIS